LEEEQLEILDRMRTDTKHAIPPLQRLEHALHPFVSFVIMPIFALANAGISLVGIDFSSLFSTHVAVGVMLGLLLGKPIGIVGSTLLLTKLKIAAAPSSMTFQRLLGLGFLASIGFTMSMFVSTLAFDNPDNYLQAMIGIFAASILGGIIGYRLLKKA
jgi:NhaA family Na+:H+ antiporter